MIIQLEVEGCIFYLPMHIFPKINKGVYEKTIISNNINVHL